MAMAVAAATVGACRLVRNTSVMVVLASLQAEGSVVAVPSRKMVPLCCCDNDGLVGDQFAEFFRVEETGGVKISGSRLSSTN